MDRKVELTSFGGVETLRMAEFEPPTPAAGEILIRQDAIGVNFIDIYQRIGLYPLPLPAVLGVEATGIVEAVGEAVHGLKVGDRIAYAGLRGAMRRGGCCRAGAPCRCPTTSTRKRRRAGSCAP